MKHNSLVLDGAQSIFQNLSKKVSTPLRLPYLVIVYTIIMYLLPDSMKAGVLLSCVFTALFFYISQSVLLSLFIVFFVSSLLYLPAKSYPFEVASIAQYRYDPFPGGIIDSVDITTSDVFNFLLIVYFIKHYITHLLKSTQQYNNTNKPTTIILILTLTYFYYFTLSLYSTINLSPFPTQGFVILMQQTKIITAFLSINQLFAVTKLRVKVYLVLAAAYLFQGTIGLYKFFTSLTTFGLLSRLPTLDSEQATILARSGGVSEPNTYALYTAVLLLITFPYVLHHENDYLKSGYIWLGLFNIITSQSRTVWFGLGGIIFITLIIHKQRLSRFVSLLFIPKLRYIFLSLIAISFIVIIIPRMSLTSLFFSEEGGGQLRLEMFREGLQLLARAPLTGFGVGSGLRIFFDNFPAGYIYTFPHPVHNAYLQIALESGIPALIAFILPFYFIMKQWMIVLIKRVVTKNESFSYGATCAIILLLFYFISQPILLRNDVVLIGTSISIAIFYLYGKINYYG